MILTLGMSLLVRVLAVRPCIAVPFGSAPCGWLLSLVPVVSCVTRLVWLVSGAARASLPSSGLLIVGLCIACCSVFVCLPPAVECGSREVFHVFCCGFPCPVFVRSEPSFVVPFREVCF